MSDTSPAQEPYPTLADVMSAIRSPDVQLTELQTEVAVSELFSAISKLRQLCCQEVPPDPKDALQLADRITATRAIAGTLLYVTGVLGWEALGVEILELLISIEEEGVYLSCLDDEFIEQREAGGDDAALAMLASAVEIMRCKFSDRLKQLAVKIQSHIFYYHPWARIQDKGRPRDESSASDRSRPMSLYEAGKIYFRGQKLSAGKALKNEIESGRLTAEKISDHKWVFKPSEWPEDLRGKI